MGIFSNLFKKQKVIEAPKQVLKEEIQQEEIKNKIDLARLYTECPDINENSIVEIVKKYDMKKEINEQEVLRIFSRKIASNYARFGTSNYDIFSTYMPLTEMIEKDIPQMVESEYSKILSPQKSMDKEYVKKLTKENIVERIAKKVGAKYNTEKTLEIPQVIATLAPEEKDYFTDCIHKEVGDEEFSTFQEAILSMKMMEDGTKAAKNTENFIASIQTEKPENIEVIADIGAAMANDTEQLQVHKTVNEIGFDQETMDIVARLVDAGIIDSLKTLSEENQLKTIKIISEELGKITENKKEKDKTELVKDEDEER